MHNRKQTDESKQYSFNPSLVPDMTDMSFEELIKAKPDLAVFRLSDSTVSENLRQMFKRLMIDTGLLICPRT